MTKTTNKNTIILTIAAIAIITAILVTSNPLSTTVVAQIATPSSPCPAEGEFQHWDKIIFLVEDDPSKIIPEEFWKTPMDLKIPDFPEEVVVLKPEVTSALADRFGLTPTQADQLKIEILEVKYQTVTCGLTGPQGPAGPAGADGADGADGATGPAGADGQDGSDALADNLGNHTATQALNMNGNNIDNASSITISDLTPKITLDDSDNVGVDGSIQADNGTVTIDPDESSAGSGQVVILGDTLIGTNGADLFEWSTAGGDTFTVSGAGVDTINLGGAGVDVLNIGTGNDRIGFFGTAPVVQTAAYTTNNEIVDRILDANADAVLLVSDVLATLINDLQLYGLLG